MTTPREWATALGLTITNDEVELYLVAGTDDIYPAPYPHPRGSLPSVALTIATTASGSTFHLFADARQITQPDATERLHLYRVATAVDDLVPTTASLRHAATATVVRPVALLDLFQGWWT